MSKAFTREADEPSIATKAPARGRPHAGPVTPVGARLARAKLAELSEKLEHATADQERAVLELELERVAGLAAAPVGSATAHADTVAFGAQVSIRDPAGKKRVVILASSDEIGLVPHAASTTSPIAQALLGAHQGDVVEFEGPRGVEELIVLEVTYPS
jgi:transcription elongation factor GreB